MILTAREAMFAAWATIFVTDRYVTVSDLPCVHISSPGGSCGLRHSLRNPPAINPLSFSLRVFLQGTRLHDSLNLTLVTQTASLRHTDKTSRQNLPF